MATENVRFDIGTDFFDDIYNNPLYVDKTLLIKQIINGGEKAIILNYPRRFGKSLNMDMLYKFFTIDLKPGCSKFSHNTADSVEDILCNRDMFLHLNIAQAKDRYGDDIITKYQGKYPVIFLNFKISS